jgi:hypothetical protein
LPAPILKNIVTPAKRVQQQLTEYYTPSVGYYLTAEKIREWVTEFKNNLKTKHIQSAKVVLDFKEKKCVVNSLNREAGYEDMIEFYKRMLGDRLTPHLPKD